MQENAGSLQASPPNLGPKLTALHIERTPLEGLEMAAVMQDGPVEVFSLLPPCP